MFRLEIPMLIGGTFTTLVGLLFSLSLFVPKVGSLLFKNSWHGHFADDRLRRIAWVRELSLSLIFFFAGFAQLSASVRSGLLGLAVVCSLLGVICGVVAIVSQTKLKQ